MDAVTEVASEVKHFTKILTTPPNRIDLESMKLPAGDPGMGGVHNVPTMNNAAAAAALTKQFFQETTLPPIADELHLPKTGAPDVSKVELPHGIGDPGMGGFNNPPHFDTTAFEKSGSFIKTEFEAFTSKPDFSKLDHASLELPKGDPGIGGDHPSHASAEMNTALQQAAALPKMLVPFFGEGLPDRRDGNSNGDLTAFLNSAPLQKVVLQVTDHEGSTPGGVTLGGNSAGPKSQDTHLG